MTVRVAITNRCSDLPMPSRASTGSAGFDLRAAVDREVTLAPGERLLIATGIAAAIPPGFEGQIRARSGLAVRHGLALVNAPGTIDSDYRGEISVILINLGAEPVTITRGDRIAQLVIAPVVMCEIEQVEQLPSSERGSGGFGSSGMR